MARSALRKSEPSRLDVTLAWLDKSQGHHERLRKVWLWSGHMLRWASLASLLQTGLSFWQQGERFAQESVPP